MHRNINQLTRCVNKKLIIYDTNENAKMDVRIEIR